MRKRHQPQKEVLKQTERPRVLLHLGSESTLDLRADYPLRPHPPHLQVPVNVSL